MALQEIVLTGLTARSLPEILTLTKAVELSLLALIGVLSAYILPKFIYWFDDAIDRLLVIDFSKSTKREISNIIRWSVYILVLYSAFYILGFPYVHRNAIFQIVVVLFGTKVAISALKPSVNKIDQKVNDIQVSEGSILMKLLTVSVYLIGFFVVLSILGIGGALTTVLAGAGVIGVVIGFGAKDLVSNTLSGISLAIDKPFQLGDIIEIKDKKGTVRDIGLRTTEIEAFDNRVVTVPNTQLVKSAVVNHTANDERRISIKVGVNYDSDLEKVTKTLKSCLKSFEDREKDKETQVLVEEFGESAIVLEGRVWVNHKRTSLVSARSQIKKLVQESFEDEDIDIPYPTRTIIQE